MRNEMERAYDAYLAASARLGDREALSRLAERWQRKLYGHAWRLTGETELARDAVQEAWVEIIRGIGRLNDVEAFPAWAFRIVTRRCTRAIRRRQRKRRAHETLRQEPQADIPGNPPGEANADMAVVQVAMTKLPPEQRAVLALFYLEELRIAEIAVALDTPPGTIKTRLMHARRKLRARLEGEAT